mgnify:CR=1 FL=1
MQNEIEKAALELVDIDEDGEFDENLFRRRLEEVIKLSREDCEALSIEFYRETAIKVLPDMRNAAKGFEERSFERWKFAFDHLEMMWEIAQELGELNANEFDQGTDESTQVVMAALSNIFPKALLVTNEIICLLKGGFPDGALARWRSLHELTVTAMYILQEGREPAIAYMLSFHFAARRAALQMNEHSELAGFEKFSKRDLEDFDTRRNEAEKALGRKITKDKDGEWPAINLKHRDFAAIEKRVGMDHWRPRYKWASQHTHADLKPVGNLLGMSESKEAVNLVGASNSGFADPFMMTAISLAQITNTYLSVTPNLDRVVHSNVLLRFSDEMSGIAMKIQNKSKNT